MNFVSGPLAAKIAFTLSRIIVPLWVGTGAIFKLVESDPRLLPKTIYEPAVSTFHLNLDWLLAVLIGLEFLAVGVMVFLPRLARSMAAFMLGCFCLILVGEIMKGNAHCGCLGNISPSPWVMLGIDGALLLGILGFKPAPSYKAMLPRNPLIGATIVCLLGFGLSIAQIISPTTRDDNAPQTPHETAATAENPQTSPPVPYGQTPPSYFYEKEVNSWVGKKWEELELPHYMNGWPRDIHQGRRYVIFFSRSCDHCQTLLEKYFEFEAPYPTALVAIPETKKGFNPDTALLMNFCHTCVENFELEPGCNWMLTPPLVLALENGVVVCAAQAENAENPTCFR